MKVLEGSVTLAKGFMAASAQAGIKYQGRTDMALVYTKEPAVFAGTFTTNVVKAAPVQWDKSLLEKKQKVHAVVLNSGIANACTGEEGKELNRYMASVVAKNLQVQTEEVLTASTGVIGMQLAKEPLKKGADLLKENLGDNVEKGHDAAKAIMTTDTVSKEAGVSFEAEGTTIHVGGMSKGSGMIHPNMATMLSVTTTDAAIDGEDLQELVSEIVSDTFNMISVDRDTSTNDTYVVLANGASGVTIKKGTKAYDDFKAALLYVSESLAKQMAADGRFCTVYPCHNLCPVGPEILADLISCTDGILDGSISGKPAGLTGPGRENVQLYQSGRCGIYWEKPEKDRASFLTIS